jgi:RND family efflux transporter MFP subunit
MKNILLIFISLLVASSCKKNYEDIIVNNSETNIIAIRTATVEYSTEPIPVSAIGRVAPNTTVKLSFKTGGYINELALKEGDYVKKGRVIAKLHQEEINAQVLKAKQANEKAIRDLERIKAMYQDAAATLENVQDLMTLVEVTQADYDIATYNQQYSTITSPISGRVIKKMAEKNELVSPGQPIVVIADESSRSHILVLSISDKDLNNISTTSNVEVKFDAFPDEIIKGQVSYIAETADEATGTFTLEVNMNPNPNIRLRNGLIGRANIYTPSNTEYAKLPINGLVEANNDKAYFYTIDTVDGTARQLEVSPVYISNRYVYIDAIELTERISTIITDGAGYLTNGAKINIQE